MARRPEDLQPAERILQGMQLLMFDWSGVISDDRPPVYEANMRLFDKFGLRRISMQEWLVASRQSAIELLLEQGVVTTPDEIFEAYTTYLDAVVSEGIEPTVYPDAQRVIPELAQRGLHLAVISSHPTSNLIVESKKYGIDSYFRGIHGSVRDKAVAMQEVSQGLEIPLGQSLYIGDTIYDIRSAQRAGVRCSVGITTGYHTRERLNQERPNFVIGNLSSLLSG